MAGTIPPSTSWDDTNPHIVLAETRARAAQLTEEVRQHDGKIETLQAQVQELRTEWRAFRAVVGWGLGVMGSLTTAGILAALAKLYGGK